MTAFVVFHTTVDNKFDDYEDHYEIVSSEKEALDKYNALISKSGVYCAGFAELKQGTDWV